jgi:plasmid replication initiation protein
MVTLRKWLKVTEGKLDRYVDFKRRVIEPALKQINDNPEGAGFSVDMQPIKVSRAVDRIRFTLKKTSFRAELEDKIKRDKANLPSNSSSPTTLRTATYEQAKKAAPSFDVFYLETEWREWIGKQKSLTKNPDGSFISFCKKKQKSATA